MAATVCVNGMNVVHKSSGGQVCFFPDVCLTPSNERYILKKPDGTRVEGRTDSQGKITVEQTVSGVGSIVFPDLKEGALTFGN